MTKNVRERADLGKEVRWENEEKMLVSVRCPNRIARMGQELMQEF